MRVDADIPGMLHNLAKVTAGIFITSATVVGIGGWQMLLPAVAIIMSGFYVGRLFIAAKLPLKRLSANAKAPILAHIHTALRGLGKFSP